MNQIFCLDEQFSTTRQISSVMPAPMAELTEKKSLMSALVLNANRKKTADGGLRTHGHFKMNRASTKEKNDAVLITIITVAYNAKETIEQTILSVIGQSYSNVEFIVVDGGSTDGTLDIIRKYEHAIDYWISESDTGISNAFNKGILLSTGEYHLVLNADDWYDIDAISTLAADLPADQTFAVLCSDARVVDEEGKFVRIYRSLPENLLRKMSLAHNTCLTNSEMAITLMGYNESKKIAMDHDLMLRLLKANGFGMFKKVNGCIANYRLGGVSDKLAYAGFREVRENLIDYGVPKIRSYSQYYYNLMKHFFGLKLNKIKNKK